MVFVGDQAGKYQDLIAHYGEVMPPALEVAAAHLDHPQTTPGGVGFRKGCFIGQEVVSRMQHRGTARRRVLLVSAGADLPAAGTELRADGKVIGTLGSASGPYGLAIARIDRVKAALDAGSEITAGDVAVSLAIPAWASFTYPEAANAEDA